MSGVLTLVDRSVDLGLRQVDGPDGAVSLSEREAGLLQHLVDRPGQDVSREELLEQVWGYRPGVQSRAVDIAVARLRSKIEPDLESPRHILTVRGHGYRFEPAERSAAPSPPPSVDLFGRSAELATLHEAVRRGRPVVLWGPAGVGKTRLARELAEGSELQDVTSCDLRGARSRPEVLSALGRALAVPLRVPRADPATLLKSALVARGRCLLVLDHCEGAQTVVDDLVSSFARVTTEARFVLVSRLRSSLPGPSLRLGGLDREAARALFLARAARVGSLRITGDLDPLLHALDDLPLAIELAAARTGLLDLGQLQTRMAARFELLARPATESGQVDRVLWSALALSWELLSEPLRAALCQLTVFCAPCTLDAAEGVLAGDLGVLDLLSALHGASLLELVDGPVRRYRLLDSVREHAAAADPGLAPVRSAALARHARWFAARSVELERGLHGPDGGPTAQVLALELPEYLAVATDEDRDPGVRVQALRAARLYLDGRGPDDLLGAVLDSFDVAPMALLDRARLLRWRGVRAASLGDTARAREELEQAAREAEAGGDLLEAAKAHAGLSDLHRAQGDLDVAEATLHTARSLAAQAGEPGYEGRLGDSAGILRRLRGDYAGARSLHAWAERALRVAGDLAGLASALKHGASAALRESDFDGGLAMLAEAQTLSEQLGDTRRAAQAQGTRATLLLELGDVDAAQQLLEDVWRRYAALGETGNRTTTALQLASVHLERGQGVHAATWLRRAAALADTTGSALHRGVGDLYEGIRHLLDGRARRARERFGASITALSDRKIGGYVAVAVALDAVAAAREGDLEGAEARWGEAARALAVDGGADGAALLALVRAAIAVEAGDPRALADARQLLAGRVEGSVARLAARVLAERVGAD